MELMMFEKKDCHVNDIVRIIAYLALHLYFPMKPICVVHSVNETFRSYTFDYMLIVIYIRLFRPYFGMKPTNHFQYPRHSFMMLGRE